MLPPTALSRAVSESCCFDPSASDDDLDPDDPKVTATWLTQSTSGKVNFKLFFFSLSRNLISRLRSVSLS